MLSLAVTIPSTQGPQVTHQVVPHNFCSIIIVLVLKCHLVYSSIETEIRWIWGINEACGRGLAPAKLPLFEFIRLHVQVVLETILVITGIIEKAIIDIVLPLFLSLFSFE